MNVPVYWVSYEPDTLTRGYWDQSFIAHLLEGRVWRVPGGPTFGPHYDVTSPEGWAGVPIGSGAVVVIPARHNAKHVDQLNEDLARFEWLIMIGTGDEEAVFDWSRFSHPRRKVWAMGQRAGVDLPLGSGYSQAFPELCDAAHPTPGRLAVFFAGQDTHTRRHEAIAAMRESVPENQRLIVPTQQFLADGSSGGLGREEYALMMSETRFAPAPSGPESPDSFRLYEALEAGVVPIADGATPHGSAPGYWDYVFGEPVPFPIADNWQDALDVVQLAWEPGWPLRAAKLSAWWQQWKRRLAYKLADAVYELGGVTPDRVTPDDRVTVVLPTCPVVSHPDTAMIETVVESLRSHLPTAEIVIVCDGVRPKMADRADDYAEHLLRLTRICRRWRNVVPVILDEWQHQAGGTRAALELVMTPLLLFVEHDTPLADAPIDWDGLCDVVEGGEVNMARLHHQTTIHPDHEHMMLDGGQPQTFGRTDARPDGVPLLRTFQWSQRPHLATTKFYRERVMPYFGKDSRTYIEWILHGAVQHGIERGVEQQWNKWRVAIYYPPGGNLERSWHLDGRKGFPNEDPVWAYDGPTPDGAPPPT